MDLVLRRTSLGVAWSWSTRCLDIVRCNLRRHGVRIGGPIPYYDSNSTSAPLRRIPRPLDRCNATLKRTITTELGMDELVLKGNLDWRTSNTWTTPNYLWHGIRSSSIHESNIAYLHLSYYRAAKQCQRNGLGEPESCLRPEAPDGGIPLPETSASGPSGFCISREYFHTHCQSDEAHTDRNKFKPSTNRPEFHISTRSKDTSRATTVPNPSYSPSHTCVLANLRAGIRTMCSRTGQRSSAQRRKKKHNTMCKVASYRYSVALAAAPSSMSEALVSYK